MATLTWDEVGTRTFQSGLDRGVLYFPDGRVYPWNGLTNVQKNFGQSAEPIHFDGVKIADIVSTEGFSATISAITYPEEFEEFYGNAELRSGVYLGDQPSKTFTLAYRTKVGNDVAGDSAGYKIHIIYNASAVPSDHSYSTVSDDPELSEFEWELTARPEILTNYRPSAHITLDSTKMAPSLIEYIESQLYGTSTTEPTMIPLQGLVTLINEWYLLLVVDNEDGTFTVSTDYAGYIVPVNATTYDINSATITWVDADTYDLTGTKDIPGS